MRRASLLRLLRLSALTLFGLLATVILAITLFFSQPKLHLWLFSQLDGWTDGMISVQHSEGHIFDSIRLHGVAVRHPDLSLDINQLDWSLNLRALWYGQIHLPSLLLDELNLALHPQGDAPPAADDPQPFAALLGLPLWIDLEEVTVQRLTFEHDGQSHLIEDLHLAASWQLRKLVLETLQLRYLTHRLSLAGQFKVQDSRHFSSALTLSMNSDELPPVALSLAASGSLQEMAITLDSHQPLTLRSRHQLSMPTTGPITLQSQLDWQLDPMPAVAQTLSLSFDRDDRLSLTSQLSLADGGALALEALLQLSTQQLDISLDGELDLTPLSPGLPLHYRGSLALAVQDFTNPQLSLRLHDTLLQLPEQDFQLHTRLRLQGHDLLGEMAKPHLDIHFDDLQLQQAEHQAQFQGPLSITLDRPANTLDLASTGLTINYLQHQGTLRFRARGDSAQRLHLDALHLTLGDNTLEASGQYAEQLQLHLRANLTRLEQLLPELQGHLHLEAQINGDAQQPHVRLWLRGERLGYQELRLHNLNLQARTPLLQPWLGELSLHLQDLQMAADDTPRILLDSLEWQRQQQGDQWHSQLALRQALFNTTLSWHEQVTSPSQLQLIIDAWDLHTAHAGDWVLDQAASLHWLAPQSLRLEPLCLRAVGTDSSSFCLHATEQTIHWQGDALPVFDWLAPLLPEGIALQGAMHLHGQLVLGDEPAQDWRLQQTLQVSPLALNLEQMGYRIPITIHDLSLELAASQRTATLRSQARLNELGSWQAALNLDNAGQNWQQAILSGTLEATLLDLALPEDLLSLLDLQQQRLTLRSRLSGRLDDIQHDTHAELAMLADLPLLGLHQQQLELKAALDEDTITLDGLLTQPDQRGLRLRGKVHALQAVHPQAIVHLEAEDFQLINSHFASLRSGTAIRITLQDGQLDVAGSVSLHNSRIDLQRLPLQDRTRVSGDEVIVDLDGLPLSDDEHALAINLFLAIAFDEEVQILLHDVNAYLGGALVIHQQPGQDMRASGRVLLDRGEVRIDPRNRVQIERSSFTFTGLLGNPNLDVQLSRRVDAYRTNLNVTGTATSPQFVFYSTPSLSQGNIINLMLFGRAVDVDREPNYESQLLSALYKLGISGNTPVLSQITTSLGIHDVYFDIQDEQSSNLILGRALTNRLYIRYAMGLSDRQTNAIQMFYRIGRRWSLESVSSDEHQSLDIIWSHER